VPLFGKRKSGARGEPADSAAASLEPLLFGDLPLDQWPPHSSPPEVEPWASFIRAREALAAGDQARAIAEWRQVAMQTGLESRHVLQAWTFLRAAGVVPDSDTAKSTLAVVVVVPVGGGHDTLAGYADGSVRYLNHSGAAAVIDDGPPEIAAANAELIGSGEALVQLIGPWDQPALPPVPSGTTRLIVLTPSGPHFGQGAYEDLHADPMGGPVLDAALRLLNLVVAATTG